MNPFKSILGSAVLILAGLTQSSRLRHLPTFCLALLLSAALAPASTVANWDVVFDPNSKNPATSGLTTDSPTFGGAAEAMDAIGIAGLFGTTATPASVSLAVGETLTVTMSITLTGGDVTTNAYRFSVQNDNGKFSTSPDNWGGGWSHVLDTNSSGDGFYSARTNGNYMSTASNAVRLATKADAGFATNGNTLSADSAASYLWIMSITRDSATTVDLFSSFVGGDNDYSESYTLSLDASQTNGLFTYNAIGIQATGQGNLDQLSITNAQYSVIPEPSVALLGSLGLLALLRRRRN